MKKYAIFPGSFSPFTNGHKSIVDRMRPLFDKIVIAIGINSLKEDLYPIEKKIEWIQNIYLNQPKVTVVSYKGLTVDLCEEQKAKYIIRGIRDEKDFKFEKTIAQNNRELAPEIETLLITTLPRYSHISSSIVRDIIKNNGDVSKLIPNNSDFHQFFNI